MKMVAILFVILPMIITTNAKLLVEEPDNLLNGHVREKRADDANMDSLTMLVQQQAAVIQSLQSSATVADSKIQVLEAKVAALEGKSANANKQVAFTVRFQQALVDIGTHNTLLFDTVVTNIGGAYDTHTGFFTAPVAGVYAFSLSLMSSNDHGALNVVIDQHGNSLALVYAEGSSDTYDQSSTEVLTHLTAGEQVCVRHNQGDTFVAGQWWTVFSGFLLQAD